MENLIQILDQFEMKFNEGQKIRFSDFIGEEHEGKSFKKMCEISGLEECQKQLSSLKRSGQCTSLFDDGWFHLTFDKSDFPKEFINGIDFD